MLIYFNIIVVCCGEFLDYDGSEIQYFQIFVKEGTVMELSGTKSVIKVHYRAWRIISVELMFKMLLLSLYRIHHVSFLLQDMQVLLQ